MLVQSLVASALDVGPGYRVVQQLGEGGFGAVYEAIEEASGARVALKALMRATPQALAQFKREFRALSGISHVNLVALRELYEHAGTWFIAMDLIEGTDLLSWVRGVHVEGHGFDEARLRAAFTGIAEGLAALHGHGLLHRDLKPSNVRITREGRAVLLDFGLVTASDAHQQSTQQAGAGTVAYMAPEQVKGQKLGPAADVYALGVCLYEALTGSLPFEIGAAPLALMLSKTEEDPAPPRTRCPEVPADLDWLCSQLLDRDPGRRPSAEAVVRTLGGPVSGRVDSAPRDSQPLFEGRSAELETLAAALARTHEGELSLAFVEGESGIGKSALLAEFGRQALERAPQSWVLRGRCYEHERVPYKAFDGCIDALASALAKLPENVRDALLPRHVGLLGDVFPALRNLKLKTKRALPGAPAEPGARRREAFRVLAELLDKLSEARPILLLIDDIQWADQESFQLLRTLVEEAPPPLFIACTVRPEDELSPAVRAALAELKQAACTHWIQLRGLAATQTLAFARKLLGERIGHEVLVQIAHESHGHPMLIAELARYAERGGAGGPLTLDAAIRARIEALPPAPRSLLEVLAVSHRPRGDRFLAAVIKDGRFGEALTGLLAERLARRNAELKLLPVHDRIRAVVVACTRPARLRELHRVLAFELARGKEGEASELALHWDEGGEPAQALSAYVRAAEEARAALAFARVVEHCTRALELRDAVTSGSQAENDAPLPDVVAIRTQRAQALAALGRSAEAAIDFERAAADSRGAEAARLRLLAARHQIQSAQFDAGMNNVSAVFAELAIPLPRSTAASLARIAWERLRIAVRGYRVTPRQDTPPEDKLALDAMAGLIYPLTSVDFLTGSALNMHHLRRALQLGEPGHAAQALAHAAVLQVLEGKHDGEALFARSQELMAQTDDPVTRAFIPFVQGGAALLKGDPVAGRAYSEAAEALLVDSCPGQVWLLTNTRVSIGCALYQAGEHARLSASSQRWLAEARERRDAFAVAAVLGLGFGFLSMLMRDEPDEALAAIDRALEPWKGRPYGFAQHGELIARAAVLSYRGQPEGWSWFVERAKEHGRAFIYRAGPLRDILSSCQAMADLCMVPAGAESEWFDLSHKLDAHARRFSRSYYGRIFAPMMRAQAHALRGATELAVHEARRAHNISLELGQQCLVLSAAYMLGLLEGGEGGRARRSEALAFFRSQGWKDPWLAVTMTVPVVRLLESRR